jgi:hypothetical protein
MCFATPAEPNETADFPARSQRRATRSRIWAAGTGHGDVELLQGDLLLAGGGPEGCRLARGDLLVGVAWARRLSGSGPCR